MSQQNLLPADMPAVLARTNLKPSSENFLLPIYEAISNAIYAAQSQWKTEVAEKGVVRVEIKTGNFEAIISDNGCGLDENNFKEFLTPFTGYRLKKGGKGFGRFIAFKVFDEIHYNSGFLNGTESRARSFAFDIFNKPQIKDELQSPPLMFAKQGCSVRYRYPKKEFESIIEAFDGADIVERIIRYFLPFFLSNEMPSLSVIVDGAEFDAKSHFSEFFTPEIEKELEVDFDGESVKFSISLSKVKRERLFKEHMVLLFADGRIIGTGRRIANIIGNEFFEDPEGNKQIYIASVSGEFLNTRANTARTEIEASKEEIDAIVKPVTDIILNIESDFVKQHRGRQTDGLKKSIIRNPLLRSALRGKSLSEYVGDKPMSWKAENFVSDLALTRLRDQSTWEKEFADGISAPEKLIENREKLFEQLENENKDALASYVAHRKSVIEVAEAILGFQDNGKMSLEDTFHDIIHPRYADSDDTKFYQHNLWLLDEKLAFFSYCSSDRTLHGKSRKTGDKVGDLVLFEDCSIYQQSDRDTVVLIEFKRPGREEYKFGDSRKDPVQQVIETAVQIREAGRIVSKSGRTIEVPKGVRLYAYVVADMEPKLRDVCESHNMSDAWDQRGYYYYHKKKDVFIEVSSYDKMIEDAKKRNAAFFDILLGELLE